MLVRLGLSRFRRISRSGAYFPHESPGWEGCEVSGTLNAGCDAGLRARRCLSPAKVTGFLKPHQHFGASLEAEHATGLFGLLQTQ